jgi:hypothetical protein
MKTDFFEESVPIGAINELLRLGWEIEVSSPDGWVPVTQFVDKGEWEEYRLETESGRVVRCNENHLFETPEGWVYSKDLLGDCVVLTQNGEEPAVCVKTGAKIPIVDIQVDHPNHRYYTEGVSSHNTGVGKSLAMCHMAASALTLGKNVLYITMEMSEERIAERIDANLMNIPVDQLETLPKDIFESKITKIATKTTGRLIIKEYPTASAHAGHFRALLNELKLKKDFSPDIIYIDYLNICASARMKGLGNSINTYSFVKAIAEEIRGLAVEFDVPIWSATQTTRSGFSNTDVDLTDTSESFGLPATADFMIALISTEELDRMNQIMVKQLKNRYNDPTKNKRFVIGVDRSKMRLFDAEPSAQTGLVNDGSGRPQQASTAKKDFSEFKME